MKKLAVIGLGKMGLLHAGVHSALNQLPITAVCEKDRFLASLARRILPTVETYQDYCKMIQVEDPDAVVITTPIHTHAEIILDIIKIKQDIGIFVEKPLANSHSDAIKLCDSVRQSNVIHMVGFQKRYVPTFEKAKEILADGEIGNGVFFRSHSFSSDVFKEGQGWRFKKESGGVTLDLGPHLLDLITWYFGEPTIITGIQKAIYSKEVEDYVHVNMRFENGLIGYADLCWSIRNYRLPELHLEIHGTNGVLVVNDDYIKVQMDKDGKNLTTGHHLYRKPELQPSVPFLLGDSEFTLEDKEFQTAVDSRRLAEPNFFTAAKINLLIDKIHDLPGVQIA